MTDWFRSWHGAPTDNKWLVIGKRAGIAPGVVSAIWWALLDHASQSLARGDVSNFDVETYAAFSGFEPKSIEDVLRALTEKGLILNGILISWLKRQPSKEDVTATRRKRTQRERDKEAERCASRPVTIRHDVSHAVTAEQNREEQNREEQSRVETDKKQKVRMSSSDDDAPSQAIFLFNAKAKEVGWPQCQKKTKKRLGSIAARLKDCGGIEGWRIAIDKAGASDFLTGKVPRTNGHQNWTFDIDALLSEGKFTKLMEGSYDNRKSAREPDKADQAIANGREALAILERRRSAARDEVDQAGDSDGGNGAARKAEPVLRRIADDSGR